MAGTLAPKRHHYPAKNLTKIHISIELAGDLQTEDGHTAKMSESPKVRGHTESSRKPQKYGEIQKHGISTFRRQPIAHKIIHVLNIDFFRFPRFSRHE